MLSTTTCNLKAILQSCRQHRCIIIIRPIFITEYVVFLLQDYLTMSQLAKKIEKRENCGSLTHSISEIVCHYHMKWSKPFLCMKNCNINDVKRREKRYTCINKHINCERIYNGSQTKVTFVLSKASPRKQSTKSGIQDLFQHF